MRMTKWAAIILGLCASVIVTAPARAAVLQLQANLDGLQMVPPDASPAFGSGGFTLDNVSGAFTVTSGSYQDLLGGSNSVFLNEGAAGANGAFIAALTNDTPGAMTGTYSGAAVLSAGQIASMSAGNTYVRVTSAVFPGGEIRGQLVVTAVPEPASLGVLGLAGVLMLRRRSKVGR